MDTGVARRPIVDEEAYIRELTARLDPTASALQKIVDQVQAHPCRVVFTEGEEERALRAASIFRDSGYGTPILLGREDRVRQKMTELGLPGLDGIEITNSKLSAESPKYWDFLYERLQRRGYLFRDCQRMINQERNVFAACIVACGDADAMVTGLTRNYHVALEEITRVIDTKPDTQVFGISMLVAPGRTVFVADTAVNVTPNAEQLADTAVQAAATARQMGHDPRVALLSFSNFGNPMPETALPAHDAVRRLEEMQVDFEFDGEMSANVALNYELIQRVYPFCRLTGPANVLIMPGLNAASLAPSLVQALGGAAVIGPLLMGLAKPAQIVPMGITVTDMVNMAALAAYDAIT